MISGKPLHAFDALIFRGEIMWKKSKRNGFSKLWMKKDRKLSGDELMIQGSEKGGLCIAGVFRGVVLAFQDQTTSISSNRPICSPDIIRKRSTVFNGLRRDASFPLCFETWPPIPEYASLLH